MNGADVEPTNLIDSECVEWLTGDVYIMHGRNGNE